MSLAALFCAALVAAPEPAPTLVVRARGLDEVALRDALRPRSGGADVVLLRDAAGAGPDHTFVDIALAAPDIAITVILRDGRVFVRRAPAPAGPRDAARLVATMLAAIADEALDPLPERAQSPALVPSAQDPPAARAPAPDLPLAPEPGPPAQDPSPGRGPSAMASTPGPSAQEYSDIHTIAGPILSPPPGPSAQAPSAPAPTRPPTAPAGSSGHVLPATRPRPELALVADGAPVIGLGVPGLGLVAAGAALGLHLRGARPWHAAAALRVAANEAGSFAVTRIRVGLGAGAWWSRGRFDLRASAGVSVEPWLVARDGRRVRAIDGAPPLLGAHLRLAPSFALPGPFRVGAFAELSASAAPSGRAVQISLADAPLFVLGGLELSVGLELHLRLVARRPR